MAVEKLQKKILQKESIILQTKFVKTSVLRLPTPAELASYYELQHSERVEQFCRRPSSQQIPQIFQ